MYNLIVAGAPGTWDGDPSELERARVAREFTDDLIATKYAALDQSAIAELVSFPARFAYESGRKTDARLGRVKSLRSRQGVVRFDYELYQDPCLHTYNSNCDGRVKDNMRV